MNREAMRERFGLRNGQFFGEFRLKNLRWFLNQEHFGFGDLRDEDIARIQGELSDHETFEGFNEHHGTQFQQRKNPMVVITRTDIIFPETQR